MIGSVSAESFLGVWCFTEAVCMLDAGEGCAEEGSIAAASGTLKGRRLCRERASKRMTAAVHDAANVCQNRRINFHR